MSSSHPGIGVTLIALIGILIVSVVAVILFFNQATTTAENMESLASSSLAYNSKLRLLNLYETAYIAPFEENPRMIKTISYACQYGDEPGWTYTMSDPLPIIFDPDDYLENYFDTTTPGNYYFYVDCGNGTASRQLEMGSPPPDDADDVLVSRMDVPLPYRNRTEAYLYRWQ